MSHLLILSLARGGSSARGQPSTRGSFNPPRGPRGGSSRFNNRNSAKPNNKDDKQPDNSATPNKWSDNKSTSDSQQIDDKPKQPASKSWAQIAKPPSPKPQPKPIPVNDHQTTSNNIDDLNKVDSSASQKISSKDNISWEVPSDPAPTSAWDNSKPDDNWKVNESDSAWNINSTNDSTTINNAWNDNSNKSVDIKDEEKSSTQQPQQQQSQPTAGGPPGFGAPKPNSRAAQRARQDAAVVMPGDKSQNLNTGPLGVQFGSLSLLENSGSSFDKVENDQSSQQVHPNTTTTTTTTTNDPTTTSSTSNEVPQPESQQSTQQVQQPTATDIASFNQQSLQQPTQQNDVYAPYFQQPQQQQPQQQPQSATSTSQPSSEPQPQPQQQNQIQPQFPYNVPDQTNAYSNVFSGLGQPNQLSALGQSHTDYATLYNDQVQRDFALQQANYYNQTASSAFGRQINGHDDVTKGVPPTGPSINQTSTPSIATSQQQNAYPGMAPMPYYFNPYAAYGAPNFYSQAPAYGQFPKYPIYPPQPAATLQQQPKPTTTASPYAPHTTAHSPSPYQYEPSAYDAFLNQTIAAGSPISQVQAGATGASTKPPQSNRSSNVYDATSPEKSNQQQRVINPQSTPHQPGATTTSNYNAFGSQYQAPPLFQTPSYSHFQGYGGWQGQQRYGGGYP